MEGIVSDGVHKKLVQISTVLMIVVACMTILNFYQIKKSQKAAEKLQEEETKQLHQMQIAQIQQ